MLRCVRVSFEDVRSGLARAWAGPAEAKSQQPSGVSMPTATAPEATALPSLSESLYLANAEELKWYLSALPGKTPTRKADLVDALLRALTDPAGLARLWAQLSPEQQQVVGEVVHHGGGRYDAEVIAAKYAQVAAPRTGRDPYAYSYGYGAK